MELKTGIGSTEKPIWKGKKFAYALGTFVAALVVAILPAAFDMDAATVDMLESVLPLVFVIGALAITGHTLTDIMAVWKEGVQAKSWPEAGHDLIDVIANPEQETDSNLVEAVKGAGKK